MSPVAVPQVHARVVERLRARTTRLGLLRGAAAVGLALLAGWATIGVAERAGFRSLPLLLDVGLLAVLGGILWRTLRRLDAVGAEARVSASMDEAGGLPAGVVQSALELSRGTPDGVSESLVGRLQRETAARLDLPVERLAGRLGDEVDRAGTTALRVLAVVTPLLILAALVTPERTARASGALVRPIAFLAGPELPPLVAATGTVEVRRGTDAAIVIEAPLRDEVVLRWQAAGDVSRSTRLEVIDGRAVHVFEAVSARIGYEAEAIDGARTGEFEVVPVDPLFVTDVTVRLNFPAYLARPSEEYRGDLPPFLLPAGTEVNVSGRASRPLASGALRPDLGAAGSPDAESVGPEPLSLDVEGATFSRSWTPRSNAVWTWDFTDADGGTAAAVPQPLAVTVLPDAAPIVRITLPAVDTLLPLNLRQPLVIEAEDDYGLSRLELVAWRVDALGESGPRVSQAIDLGGSPAAMARPLLDATSWELVPGDEVRYFARVVDVHPSGQIGRTAEYVLRMPRADEMRRDAQMRLEDAARRLDELMGRADEAARETREMERRADAPERARPDTPRPRGSEDPTFREREEVRNAIGDQQRMIAEADSLNSELEQMARALEDAGAADPEFDEDLEELQRLLEELGGSELQERMEELAEQVDEMNSEQARDALEELASEQEDFRERLEEALERARRAAVEQEFRNTTREAGEIAEEQAALAGSLETGDDLELRREQQAGLREDAEELAGRMDDLGDQLLELGEEDAWRGLQEARLSTAEAMQRMDRAGAEAQEGNVPQSAAAAEQAAERMRDAAEEMMQAQQQMMAERAAAYESALQRTAQDALALARRQGEIQERMRGASGEELAAMRGDVAAVSQGIENLAENLDVAARTAGADQRPTAESLGSALQALEQALGSLDSGSPARPSPVNSSEEAIQSLNEVAMSAMAALRAMQQGGEPQGSSAEQMMEQMEQLAQEQAEVNNQAAQMMPMNLPQQQMQEMMEQMASQQQQIASDLGQMSDQEGEDGPLGDIEAMAQEAEAIAQELQGGRLEPEVRRRQERLFHRLLDAGRSLQKDEESTERESNVPGAFERELVEALSGDDLGLLRYPMPAASQLNRLPPASRALVLQYFQRLNAAANPPAPAASAGGSGSSGAPTGGGR